MLSFSNESQNWVLVILGKHLCKSLFLYDIPQCYCLSHDTSAADQSTCTFFVTTFTVISCCVLHLCFSCNSVRWEVTVVFGNVTLLADRLFLLSFLYLRQLTCSLAQRNDALLSNLKFQDITSFPIKLVVFRWCFVLCEYVVIDFFFTLFIHALSFPLQVLQWNFFFIAALQL